MKYIDKQKPLVRVAFDLVFFIFSNNCLTSRFPELLLTAFALTMEEPPNERGKKTLHAIFINKESMTIVYEHYNAGSVRLL